MRRNAALTLALGTTLALAACGGGDDPMAEGGGESEGGSGGAITVGSANFPENELLAEIYAAALEEYDVEVDTQLNIGSRETYVAAIEDGSIDVIPEYTGGLATYFNSEITVTSSEDVLADLQENLPEGLQVLEISDAENKDSLVVTQETADELDLTAIGDLEPHAGDLTLGGPPEFETRPNGVDGLAETYGLEFASFRSLSAGSTLTVESLAGGQVDVANIFTTDPAVEANDFVVLEDPESLFAAQNVVPLISADAVSDDVEEALNEVSDALTTERLTEMMVELSDGADPQEVAQEFVDDEL
ncbi:glycine/betaine ABC transporter substrate-binding protein [Serinicoccus sp. CNJ-927]|uniref:ABC transporter substrate-binding protein n=1 Tax=Serinicoccus sp. CNJ-927 TaxID=1904970 RepID=UPI00096090FB|nr:ABC transporter substrate-binding protein [Serinicoccus sp. CNJ-927]OLT39633.1 glycine/betaine ABC transporter substrate-binding protein [Serinicoccus sp. CNJ-927]